MKFSQNSALESDTMKHFDLIVVGGGQAGCSAALAAARQGLNVLLAEAGGAFVG